MAKQFYTSKVIMVLNIGLVLV